MPAMHAGVVSRNIKENRERNKQGPPPHPYVPRNGTGRAGGKPPTARGHVKKVKGKKGKKGKKDQYDLIVNIDLTEWQLTEEQVSDFKEVFMLFDKDEDGVLTFPELNVVMKSLGQRPSEKELLTMVRAVSEDQIYDTIEFNEFLQMMSKQQKDGMNEDSLKDAFRIFDKDDDGFISVEELRHIMQSLGEKLTDNELDEMVAEADSDKDGLINYQEFVHVLCCEGVGEGNRKKTGAKKNKRDRKTREKGKENKENQERIDDGLLRGEKPKEPIVIIESQPSSSAQTSVEGSHGNSSCRPKDFLTNVISINNQVPGMPSIPPISPISPTDPTPVSTPSFKLTSPPFKLTSPMPTISNIAAAIVNSTAKKLSGSKNGQSFPVRSSSGSPLDAVASPSSATCLPMMQSSIMPSSNEERHGTYKTNTKIMSPSAEENNLRSPPTSSQPDSQTQNKHIRGSLSTSSINNNHRQAVLMACDNVALVVSVNPNVRPRGGPTPNRISTPYIKDHNALNNNELLNLNNGRREIDARDLRYSRDNRNPFRGPADIKSPSSENGRLRPVENDCASASSRSNVETSPCHKIIAK